MVFAEESKCVVDELVLEIVDVRYQRFISVLLQHWIANNLFGIAFAINGVEMLMLNNMLTGCILLGGLFVYDIFWVFYTDVMVTVAKSFEAPIKCKYSGGNPKYAFVRVYGDLSGQQVVAIL